ncbi:possible hemin ABC transporter, permease component [Parvularcula bermudensis HTCC2503]|uniref:Possible hemin ABC transporter, permease component n=1 Tax=Parvularcula bermudensis (strain ATCC BAA-594 / HTCC2503 / KCTC 12087) TaxID=314260 RepID=E0TCH1_PARBH|nr:iron ABC transporter permease [Parvularcula bermudensis]ADM10327.1 possible hemin ABC transporter, permease component [Parvularcula bermudensis HTCC2503]
MSRQVGLTGSLLAVAVIALLVSCSFGAASLSLLEVIAAMVGQGTPSDRIIVWSLRLPRALAAFSVGAALGVSGAALQGLLRNPLAGPGVLGISSMAALFATTGILFGLTTISPLILPGLAILGGIVTTAGLVIVAQKVRSVTTLLLVGIGVTSFAGSLLSLLLNLAPNPFTLSDLIYWSLGSVANRSVQDLLLCCPFILVGGGLLWVIRRGLSALTLGEEAAWGLGLDLARQRRWTILGAGMAVGGSVALAGAIGFVGIVIPHLIRPLVGFDPARSLLPSALAGGAILVAADICVRLIPTHNELGLGVIAALLGTPLFIWIAVGGRLGD